jgi:hypothetical protein
VVVERSSQKNHPNNTSVLADPQQDSDVRSNLDQQRRFRFGMKGNRARFPVHALKVIYKDCAFDLIDNSRKRERIRFSLAGKRANHGQTTNPVVVLIC